MTQTIERRTSKFVNGYEIRCCTSPSGKRTISGIAAPFNTPCSKNMARALGFTEKIARGAFSRALREKQDTIFTRDHKPELIMGRVSNGTLRMSEDTRGLRFECDLPRTTAADDLHSLIQRHDVNACSFSFLPNGKAGESWSKEKNSAGDWQASRTLLDVDLYDLSAVSLPAYDQGTEVNSREKEDDLADDGDPEKNAMHVSRIERKLWPNGVPAEVRSHRQEIYKQLAELPEPSDPERWNMWAALRVAKLS